MIGRPVIAIDWPLTAKRPTLTFACGHSMDFEPSRLDVFHALAERRLVHCWDCDQVPDPI